MPIILLLFTWKRHKVKGLWVIFIYLCYQAVTELINSYIEIHHLAHDFNFNLFDIIEYALLTYFISNIIRSKAFRIGMLVLSIGFLTISIRRISLTYFHSHIDSVSNSLESILLIIYSIFYFFEQIRKPDHIFFYSIPEFWIIVAILLYFSGTFFINLYAQGRRTDEVFQFQYSVINSAFDLLKNVLFTVAVLSKNDDKENNKIRRDSPWMNI